MKRLTLVLSLALLSSCRTQITNYDKPFVWEGANVYFLVTDRFRNGDIQNDVNFGRTENTSVLRGFEGGDLRGVIQKLDEGYFSKLGINAIWLTPLVEQVHGPVDEGTGKTYGFHGYWAKDWTALDPNFGTEADLKEMVEKAHRQGIRIVFDGVVNHTGPVTAQDPVFPSAWVRTLPKCQYNNYQNTTACTLVDNLPDVLTESEAPAELPAELVSKWKKEGRYEKEMQELDAFFARTGYPRAPKYYIMKWLSDYVRKYGIDGYRADTVKHTEEKVWKEFQQICQAAFDEFKLNHPKKALDGNLFFTVGEVYGYGISQKKDYDFGDKKVDYYQNGFKALINFDFKGDANKSYEELFSTYSKILNSDLNGKTVMNYLSSHDDGSPFDKERTKTYEAATKLLLAPGISQIYYGDESARQLVVPGAEGDANLRSNMNWTAVDNDLETKKLLAHYQKLGQFRASHPAVGAGVHKMISQKPYWFTRTYNSGNVADQIVVGLDLPAGTKEVNVNGIFKDGDRMRDAYSGATMKVIDGKVSMNSEFPVVLLEKY